MYGSTTGELAISAPSIQLIKRKRIENQLFARRKNENTRLTLCTHVWQERLTSHTSAWRKQYALTPMAPYAPSEVTSDDLNDYDVISSGHRSLDSSVADLSASNAGADSTGGAHVLLHLATPAPREPAPTQLARDLFDTPGLSAGDVQSHVGRAVGRERDAEREVRVYVDGVFDVFHAG